MDSKELIREMQGEVQEAQANQMQLEEVQRKHAAELDQQKQNVYEKQAEIERLKKIAADSRDELNTSQQKQIQLKTEAQEAKKALKELRDTSDRQTRRHVRARRARVYRTIAALCPTLVRFSRTSCCHMVIVTRFCSMPRRC